MPCFVIMAIILSVLNRRKDEDPDQIIKKVDKVKNSPIRSFIFISSSGGAHSAKPSVRLAIDELRQALGWIRGDVYNWTEERIKAIHAVDKRRSNVYNDFFEKLIFDKWL